MNRPPASRPPWLRIWLFFFLGCAAALGAVIVAPRPPAGAAVRPAASHPASTRITDENALPGTDEWASIGNYDSNNFTAYPGATSVNAGDPIGIYVRSSGSSLSARLYRLGYYQDHGARLYATYSGIATSAQPNCTRDHSTGLVRCPWAQTFGITTGTSNCQPGLMASGTKSFVDANREALAKDAARGEGEAIGAIAVINECRDLRAVGAAMQREFQTIFPSEQATNEQVTEAILRTLHSDPALGCGGRS